LYSRSLRPSRDDDAFPHTCDITNENVTLLRKVMQLHKTKNESLFIHAPEAAALLGVPLRSFHAYVKAGKIPSFRLGRHRLFRRDDLLNAMEDHREGTITGILK